MCLTPDLPDAPVQKTPPQQSDPAVVRAGAELLRRRRGVTSENATVAGGRDLAPPRIGRAVLLGDTGGV